MRRVLTAIVLLSLPIPLSACLWDDDTLAVEAVGRWADVVRVITGRFERNPELYYEMRLERAATRIQSDPDDLASYDNAGVSCDRLGRGDDAIAWMERKLHRIERLEQSRGLDPGTLREHRYRYLANVGTFWVHRWARSGADRSRLDEVKTARDFIARAIDLNPDAHFGRERYQLKALEWIISPPGMADLGLPPILDFQDRKARADEAVRGLSGLIALGNAWESVDVFHTLALALERDGERSSMALMARLRCHELIDAGRRSLLPGAPDEAEALKNAIARTANQGVVGGPRAEDEVRRAYLDLRNEADFWQRARTAFMTARLRQGLHPDTDPGFWEGYREAAPPAIPETWAPGYSPSDRARRVAVPVLVMGGFIGLIVFAWMGARRLLWGRKPITSPAEW